MVTVTLAFIALIVLLLLLGQPLFIILGAISAYCFKFFAAEEIQVMVGDIFFAGDKEILLAIPLFILAGNVMTQGAMAKRLIRLASTVTAPIPSGLAISTVLSCALFAAISGSSPVTLVAIGGLMFPALIKAGYSKNLSLGVLSAAGTLGIIIPPSIPMIIFAIMAGVSVTNLFKAGIGPGILLSCLLIGYCLLRSPKHLKREERNRGWSFAEICSSFKSGTLSLLMPGVILGGIYSGFFTATESAGVAVVYAFIVEVFIHRELKFKNIPKLLGDTAEMMGMLFLILVIAVSLNKFMTYEQIPQNLVETLSQIISTPMEFLIGVNILLLIIGCLMDIMSAILVLAPILTPMAIHYGIHPIHFGIIMIVNLEIGYLTPPMGINLFVASGVFKEPLGQVIKSTVPLVLLLLVGLVLITFIPQISLFLLDVTP